MKKKIFSGIILSLAMVFGSMPGMTMTAKAAETVVIGSDTKRWEQGNTYVLNNDVTIPDRIAVSGEATLKLNEGHTLTASAGITVPPGAKLTIEGPGTLEAYAGQGQWFNAGIGGLNNQACGTVIINGGTIIVNKKGPGAGIGGGAYKSGGDITINGGTVTVNHTNESGAGIGGGEDGNGGNITIKGER